MRLQLWSWNYAPEPTAMGPIATLWAEAMSARGHDISVVTAFPHYPPIWPQRWVPARERRNGVRILRLPLVIGHSSGARRVLEEVTYGASASAAVVLSARPDAAVVVAPSFLALQPVLRWMRVRRVPTILWLQDILPDAAATTGLLRSGIGLGAARRLERSAYRLADRIVAISNTFRQNLVEKGVPGRKIAVVYNPATRGFAASRHPDEPPRILALGNIGLSQGLAQHVAAFEATDLSARLVIAGTGEAEASVRAAVRTTRVEMLGLLDDTALERELGRAAVALVTQRPDVSEFNVPSRLMTLMARGIPIVASVRPASEVADIIQRSGGGWVTTLRNLGSVLSSALSDRRGLERKGQAAQHFAQREFSVDSLVSSFEEILVRLARPVRSTCSQADRRAR